MRQPTHIQLSRRSFLTYSPQGMRDTGKYLLLAPEAWDLLDCMEDEDASHAVEARKGEELVGWMRCTLDHGTLYAQGTWVDPKHRLRGIARSMWDRAIYVLKPTEVYVSTISREGSLLVYDLKGRYPAIEFRGDLADVTAMM